MICNIRRYLLGFVVVVSALTLAACNNPPPPPPHGVHPLTPYQHKLVSEIRDAGGKVIKQGEVLTIVLPTDRFFRQNSMRLKTRKRYAVSRIASLVKSYSASFAHPRIRITGHTDTVFARKARRKRSMEYAREIAAYLWHRGVPQRYVRVRGAGATSPIATNRTARGAAYNRRVVIRVQ